MVNRFWQWLKRLWRREAPHDPFLDAVPTYEINYEGQGNDHGYSYPPASLHVCDPAPGDRVLTLSSPVWIAEGISPSDVVGRVGTVVLVGSYVSINLGGAWSRESIAQVQDVVKPYQARDLMDRLVTSLGLVVAFDKSTVTFRHPKGVETTLSYGEAMKQAVWIDNTPFGTVNHDLLKTPA